MLIARIRALRPGTDDSSIDVSNLPARQWVAANQSRRQRGKGV